MAGDVPLPADYDGDGKTDLAVWRPTDGNWYIMPSSTAGPQTVQWGIPGDIPVSADYDGDGKADLAVWRPSDQTWHIILSSDPTRPLEQQWGLPGDIPVKGDFDRSGKQEIAVWRPSNGMWYAMSGNTGAPITKQWGLSGDVPVPADYDGDGITDYAVWRPSDENLYIVPSSTGALYNQPVRSPTSILATNFNVGGMGAGVYAYVNGDFDRDGQPDFAVWRLSDATWFVVPSSNGSAPYTQQWGLSGDIAIVGDFDGDGLADYVVWRPSTQTWYLLLSRNNYAPSQQQSGLTGNTAIVYQPPLSIVGGPCGPILNVCTSTQKCCHGSISKNGCIPISWECCSTGGSCPPGAHCCITVNGSVGCCLDLGAASLEQVERSAIVPVSSRDGEVDAFFAAAITAVAPRQAPGCGRSFSSFPFQGR